MFCLMLVLQVSSEAPNCNCEIEINIIEDTKTFKVLILEKENEFLERESNRINSVGVHVI